MSTQEWSARGIGRFVIGFDRIKISSKLAWNELEAVLPREQLSAVAHCVGKVRAKLHQRYFRSSMAITATRHGDALASLAECEVVLGRYAVTELEIACDFPVPEGRTYDQHLARVLEHFCKKPHRRGYLVQVLSENDARLRPGFLPGVPTTYAEKPGSTSRTKIYARREKLPGKQFGPPIVRLEWTLRGAALKRCLGNRQIGDLRAFDFDRFVEERVFLEKVDYVRLGQLHTRGRPRTDSEMERAGLCVVRAIASRNAPKEISDLQWTWTQAMWSSPNQLAPYLFSRAVKRAEKRKISGNYVGAKRDLTPARIRTVFVPLRLRRRMNDY